jgi:HEAT repeat protein
MSEDRLELLLELAKDDDPQARAMAVMGLAKISDPRGFAPTLVTLFDPVDEVRMAAATALGVFGDDRAFEALVQGISDPSARVQENCIWALGQIPTPRSFDKLVEVVSNGGLPADGLADAPQGAEYAEGAGTSYSVANRATAATALGERASIAGSDLATSDECIERARIALLNAIDEYDGGDDELAALVSASVWTLGHLPVDKQTTGVVLDLLEDEHEWVVRYSIEALAHFGDLAAVEPLEELAESEDEAIRELASQALEMLH